MPLDNGWAGEGPYAGWVAYSFALPYLVPLGAEPVLIHVDDEYLRKRGVEPQGFDDAWMHTPLPVSLLWSAESHGTDPFVEETVLASTVLARITGRELRQTHADDDERQRSVVVVMIPVRGRDAAFTPPHDGKLDPLTLAHWLVGDVLRSLRIVTNAPFPELRYRSLHPFVPAAFGAVDPSHGIRFDEDPVMLVLDHIPIHAVRLGAVDRAAVGNVFTQLTQGSVAASIRDHLVRGFAEHESGDYRASVLSFAITCEVMLDSALAAMLWEEGMTAADAARIWVDASSITSRVKKMYADRLGGDWRLDVSKPIGRWRENVVDVRNSVIHSGRTPSVTESSAASRGTSELISFITKRLVLKWTRYPKTLAVLCGPSSVEEHSSKAQRVKILKEMERCSAFAVDFHRWRDDWLKERALL